MASSTFPISENINRIKASPKQTQIWVGIGSRPLIDFGWQHSKHTFCHVVLVVAESVCRLMYNDLFCFDYQIRKHIWPIS